MTSQISKRAAKGALAALAVGVPLTLATTAQATPLTFNFNGTDGSSVTFMLDSMPTPDASGSNYSEFDVTGQENGSPSGFGGGVNFYASAYGGGFDTKDLFASASGTQIFSGTGADPTFSPGTFQLSGFEGNADGTLNITSGSSPASPVPTPAGIFSLAFALIGLGAFGRRKRMHRLAS